MARLARPCLTPGLQRLRFTMLIPAQQAGMTFSRVAALRDGSLTNHSVADFRQRTNSTRLRTSSF